MAVQERLSAVPLAVVADICTNTLKITVITTNHIITRNHIISTTTTNNRHGLEHKPDFKSAFDQQAILECWSELLLAKVNDGAAAKVDDASEETRAPTGQQEPAEATRIARPR